MKLFISADIEGTAGIETWEETDHTEESYRYFSAQMSREVAAVCRAAQASGARDILVKDAHGSACNLHPDLLPRGVRLMRGWENAPGGMMAGIRQGFDAAAMTGYHAPAYSDGNPLAHTFNRQNQFVRINGRYASEFLVNTYIAAYWGVPVVFLSGDRYLCETAQEHFPNLTIAPVSESWGNASISLQPEDAVQLIGDRMTEALQKDPALCRVELPGQFHVEIEFKEYSKAYRGAYFPGTKKVGPKGLEFDTADFYEVLRLFYFVL